MKVNLKIMLILINKNNLHPQLKKIYDEIFKSDNQWFILYGSSGIWKIIQSLYYSKI